MRTEIWKTIVGYEDKYAVSSKGKIMNVRFIVSRGCRANRVLKWSRDGGGYCRVSLYNNGEEHHALVHRVVAQAFIPYPNGKPYVKKYGKPLLRWQVNHIDEDKDNNSVENLEWCTFDYNRHYGTGQQRNGMARRKPVAQFTDDGKLLKEWATARDVQKETGMWAGAINSACRGLRHGKAYGYVWRYINE